MVSALALSSDDLSSNPVGYLIWTKRRKINEKEAGVSQSLRTLVMPWEVKMLFKADKASIFLDAKGIGYAKNSIGSLLSLPIVRLLLKLEGFCRIRLLYFLKVSIFHASLLLRLSSSSLSSFQLYSLSLINCLSVPKCKPLIRHPALMVVLTGLRRAFRRNLFY